MRIVFVHDHKFREVEGSIYSPGGLSNEILSRYTQWFDSITVVGRILHEDHVQKGYSKIENPCVAVVTNTGLERLVKEADAVIVRLPSINGYKAVRYAKKHKKPYLVEVVGCTLDAYWNHGLTGKVFALPAFIVMRHSVRNAPYALYVTSAFLQKRYPCRGKTAGISDVAIEPADQTVLEKRIHKIAEGGGTIILGTAGAIDVAYKGQEFVIRAIPEIERATGKTVRYELAGAGDPSRLKRIAEECCVSDKVRFLGTVKHDEIFSWFDSLDLYIQPSMLEGLSRAVVEAMSRGLPCVAAKAGGNPELIEKDYLFPKGNKRRIPTEIARCILRAEKDAERCAARNYERANGCYCRETLEASRNAFYLDFAHSGKDASDLK